MEWKYEDSLYMCRPLYYPGYYIELYDDIEKFLYSLGLPDELYMQLTDTVWNTLVYYM